jgi:DNA-binding transcriptional regulator GbsR (MarR family)
MTEKRAADPLAEAREEYVNQWGALGSAWGVNRTMSRIHALLMVSPEARNTDQIMEELRISRGNAHGNLKELVRWGLVHPVVVTGERKEFFEAEKDVWRVIQRLTVQRRRAEIEPAMAVIEDCLERTRGVRDAEARAFQKQLRELHRFAKIAQRAMIRVEKGEMGKLMPRIMTFLAGKL